MKRVVGWWVALCAASVMAAEPSPPAASETPPDETWQQFPPDQQRPPPAQPGEAVPPPTPAPSGDVAAPPRPTVYLPGVVRIEPNQVSLLSGRTLGHLVRGEMLLLGFPFVEARFAMGFGERFEAQVGYEGFWFISNGAVVGLKATLVRGQNWSLAGVAEGSAIFFTTRASTDPRGARFITGRRNFNVLPGLVVSYQGDHPRAARLFLDVRYILGLDTEPYQRDPLGGVPAAVQVGHTAMLRAGAEMPLSAKTAFVFRLGLEVHTNGIDAVVMPQCSVGLVTSF